MTGVRHSEVLNCRCAYVYVCFGFRCSELQVQWHGVSMLTKGCPPRALLPPCLLVPLLRALLPSLPHDGAVAGGGSSLMPTIGNGYLATFVQSDTIYAGG